jgi:pimeloyl-ACP methyl ester carboxylesterase
MTTLAYEIDGQGVPLVLVHAFPLTSTMWTAERRHFGPLCRVVTPDLPGLGRSPRLPQPSIAGMAQAVWGVLDALGIRGSAIVAGLSMGGYVALEMLRRQPARVRGLGLFSTRATPDTPEQRQGRMALIERIRREGLAVLREASIPKLLAPATAASNRALVDQITATALANAPEGVIDALQAMADRADATPLLAQIRCPTLVIAGRDDAVIPAAQAESMARQIPAAQLQIVEGAGHLVNLEQPAAVHAALEAFLQPLRV